jgi:hypothetical protein
MSLPLLVLGGGDPEPPYLPPGGGDRRPLTGRKGADVRVAGRRLIDAVVDRFRGLPGAFGPIYVAGPARVYVDVPAAILIDTDGDFGDNLRVGIEAVRRAHPGSQIAGTTCDVLPDAADLQRALAHYRQHAPCDLWFPLIRLPQDERTLGASAWKPRYRIVDENGQPVPFLPGHLVIFDADAMRLDFLYRLLQSAYGSRNRTVLYRRWYMIRRVAAYVLRRDLSEIVRLRLPAMTADVIATFLAARRFGTGTLPVAEVERTLRRLFVHRAHRRRFPERGARMALLEGLSLARDIDTVEEAEAYGGVTAPPPSVPPG